MLAVLKTDKVSPLTDLSSNDRFTSISAETPLMVRIANTQWFSSERNALPSN